jgi:hypothetical protein
MEISFLIISLSQTLYISGFTNHQTRASHNQKLASIDIVLRFHEMGSAVNIIPETSEYTIS